MPKFTTNILAFLACCLLATGCDPSSSETADSIDKQSVPVVQQDADSETVGTSAHADFYTVSTYDKTVDPADDLAKTLAIAEADGKRVILQIGGDWCIWCARISDYMTTNDAVRSYLEKNFLVMKVTYPGDYAEEFLAAYPKCEAYPHFFILDATGNLLHSQGTGELEAGDGYDEDVFIEFLTAWAP